MPPALVRTIAVPTAAVAGVPFTVNDDDNVNGIAKVNEAVPVCAPWVAVTTHVPGAVAVSDESVTLHPALAVSYLTGSVPVPPALVRAIGVPTAAVVVSPDTVSADVVATSPRMTGVLASVALPPEPPHPARSITAHTTTAVALPELDPRLAKRLVRAPIADTIPLGDVVPPPFEPATG
ncbi:MAG: hypothetical protein NTU77_10255 [Actinobacteria bacterium]|nr:hypothetical protein [Actinomycetota bacterium]